MTNPHESQQIAVVATGKFSTETAGKSINQLSIAPGAITQGLLRVGSPSPTLTPEECVAAGGHCHHRTGMSRASLPPQHQEACKHCGHVRWAIPREAFEYREDRA